MKEIVSISTSLAITDLFTNPNFFILFIVLIIVFFLLGLIIGLLINNRRKAQTDTSSNSNTVSIENPQQPDTLGQNNQNLGENQYDRYDDRKNEPRNRYYNNYW